MDLEWRPTFRKGQYSYTALLQLCNGPIVVLFFLQRIALRAEPARPPRGYYKMHHSIKALLENVRCCPEFRLPSSLPFQKYVTKVGVGLRTDAQRLRDEYPGLALESLVDIHDLPLCGHTSPKSLVGLSSIFLGARIDKSVRKSNWEALPLSDKQIIYAATDAWASLLVYVRMIELQAKSNL